MSKKHCQIIRNTIHCCITCSCYVTNHNTVTLVKKNNLRKVVYQQRYVESGRVFPEFFIVEMFSFLTVVYKKNKTYQNVDNGITKNSCISFFSLTRLDKDECDKQGIKYLSIM